MTQEAALAHAPTPEQIRDAWERIAPDFDRFTTPITLTIGEHVLDRAGLEPGMRFLDVAAGSGALALPAARRGAEVVATDLAPTMIERLRERARAEGLQQVDARVMDGHALDLEDDSFDLAASLNGVSLFPDLKRGLGEMVRVTRPGGRVMMICFGPLPTVEFIAFFMAAMKASVPGFQGLPTDPPPLPFQVSHPAKLRQELTDAGLRDVHVDTFEERVEFSSGAHFWDVVTASNPIAVGLVAKLTEEQRWEVQRVMDGMLRERSEGGRAVLRNGMNVGVGIKQA